MDVNQAMAVLKNQQDTDDNAPVVDQEYLEFSHENDESEWKIEEHLV